MKQRKDIIREARIQKGLSQRDLAIRANVSPTTIQKSEHGVNLSPKTWSKIKEALGIQEKTKDMGEYLLIF